MDFLYCTPSVFVIDDDYEILINLKENGICHIEIGNDTYYEDGSGVLSSESTLIKIRIPQKKLDRAKKYRVVYRRPIERKAYFSTLEEPVCHEFDFKPIEKTDNVNIYLIADVHYRFNIAKATASYFGDDIDLFVVNGDIGEVETVENYLEVCRFVGEISLGKIPVIFVRGNHDTRGHLAELFTDYFPSNNKKTYYAFSVGPFAGVALDCGEDKHDDHIEYGGVNVFERYRRKETEFLRSLPTRDGKLTFAVSHICPAQVTTKACDAFDIERDVYTEWNRELSRLGVKFMLCGHIHKAYILESNDKNSLLAHDYFTVVGSACPKDDLIGSAITISSNIMTVRFTDSKKQVLETYTIDLEIGKII